MAHGYQVKQKKTKNLHPQKPTGDTDEDLKKKKYYKA